jgi:hypothetical protein
MNHRRSSRRLRWVVIFATTSSWLAYAAGASASTLSASVVPLGGQQYRFVYTLRNDGSLGAAAIRSFDIAFPTAKISAFSAVPGFGASALPVLGDDLFVVDATGTGLVPNASLTFSVDFRWNGSGSPGTQAYDIYDSSNFSVLETGVTTFVPMVPLPPSLPVVLAIVLAGLGVHVSRRKPSASFARQGLYT